MTGKQLHEKVCEFGSGERHHEVEWLLHLAEFDRRKEYEVHGKNSLWSYVHETLEYPECQTFVRTTCVRLVRRFPQVAEHLLDGRLNMTTLAELRKALTPMNVDKLLAAASRMSKKKVRELVAALNAPVTPIAMIRPAPAPIVAEVEPETLALREDASTLFDSTQVTVGAGKALLVTGAPNIQAITPVAANQKELVVTIDDEFERDLEELGDALSHEFARKDYAGLLHRCMRKELARIRKQRGIEEIECVYEAPVTAHAEEPECQSAGGPEAESPAEIRASVLDEIATRLGRMHIPTKLQAAVWRRAEICCEMNLKNGERCRSRHRCQIDHIEPVTKGGKTELSNLRILCQKHNLEAARAALGDDFIDQCIARSRDTAKRRAAKKQAMNDGSLRPD